MKRILVFKHMACQNPGIFRDYAAEFGVEFDEIDLHAGDQIPDLEGYDGLWSMGGSMDVWQQREFPWLVDEIDSIREAVEDRQLPFLGICLGHQLLAVAMGGEAGPGESSEIGLFGIRRTEQGRNHPLLEGLPDSAPWINIHRAEVTRPPPGASILAVSDRCANHVMQVGATAFSCQFHPEVCDHTMDNWMLIPGIPEALETLIGGHGMRQFETSVAASLEAHNAAARQLFANWLKLVYQETV